MFRNRPPRHVRSSFKPVRFLLIPALLIAAAVTASSCSESSSTSNSFEVSTAPITIKTKEPISKDVIERLVVRKIGDAGVAGQPVARNIVLTPQAGGQYLTVDLNRTASCHSGALVGSAVTSAQQMMSALFLYPDVSGVQLTLFGPTEDVKDKDKPAVRILVTKEAAAKIDWFQFNEKNVGTMASEFWVEPCVNQSYQQYGSATITDPSVLAQANSSCNATP